MGNRIYNTVSWLPNFWRTLCIYDGKNNDAVTYYTENGVVKYDIDDTYVPYKFDTSAFKVENADVTSGSAKVMCQHYQKRMMQNMQ